MSDAEPPAVRASDAERERAVEALRTAAVEGRVTLEELSSRVELALSATTREALEPLTADLPAPRPAQAGRRWILGILGGGDHKGRWRVGARLTVVNIMGGADLDLRDALIESPETVITVFSLMGGSDVVIPEGVEADFSGFAILGGNDLESGGPTPRPGAPVVRVRAFSLMGGTDVKTKPTRS